MIRIMKFDPSSVDAIMTRNNVAVSGVEDIVADILKNVRGRGDEALFEYNETFDKARLSALRVTEAEIDAAVGAVGEGFMGVLRRSAANIEAFHIHQKRENFVVNDTEGVVLGQKITPMQRVGIYVPGGTASLSSTVLMDAIPARIAGVPERVMVTPPRPDGSIAPEVLAAASVAGITEIYKVGGAQAIAALAYGTKSIARVDKIVGPGNIFVATAKRQVYGLVDIDMIAGPSEILVLADATAEPRYLAADLLSQAEHDRLATAVLVCTDDGQALAVSQELERQIPLLPRADIARESIDTNGKIVVCADLAQAVEAANLIAPEHLEICTDDPFSLLNSVRNAGSIFLGKNVPEALGDYYAGPNHTLPTSGTARFSSPLSVDDFIKKSSFIYYTKEALGRVKDDIVAFAEREGLQGHGRSVAIRFED